MWTFSALNLNYMDFLTNIFFILIVIFVFNFVIFVHELGHFLAGKWRGMKIDRFQIWFGKPIWKKTINGVQYGLGSIPFGGFVSLPEMAPMESIEGKTLSSEGSKKNTVTPLDKIIVAFAGPLFSFMLALAAAVVVWKTGKLDYPFAEPVIGYVEPGSPAEEAGLKAEDRIIEIAGEKPATFAGKFDAVTTMIALSAGEEIEIVVERPGEATPITLNTKYRIPETPWYQRKAMRTIGIAPKSKVFVGYIMPNSPAAKAGLKSGDQITNVNGIAITSFGNIVDATKDSEKPVSYTYIRDGVSNEVTIQPKYPDLPENFENKMIGMGFGGDPSLKPSIIHPTPLSQIKEASTVMWVSLTKVIDSATSLDVQHFSGPIGIGRSMFDMLSIENGWKELIWFLVIFNVNLAIFNLLPFPVLDGGHIVLSIVEIIRGKAMQIKALEYIQLSFVALLFSLFLFVTSKDIGDFFTPKQEAPQFLAK